MSRWCGSGAARARQGGIILVDRPPVVVCFQKVISFRSNLEDISQLLDQLTNLRARGIEKSKEGFDQTISGSRRILV